MHAGNCGGQGRAVKNDHIHVPLMNLLIHDIETVFKELL